MAYLRLVNCGLYLASPKDQTDHVVTLFLCQLSGLDYIYFYIYLINRLHMSFEERT